MSKESVNRVFGALLALFLGASIALPALLAAKEAVNRAFESPLAEGARFERRIFATLFATADQKEGMAAFVEKRPPKFNNE